MIERLRVRIPAEAAGEFSSPESNLCADSFLFDVLSTPVLPQWHVKDPGHPANSAGGRLHQKAYINVVSVVTPKHTYSLDPTKSELADYGAVQA